MTAATPRPSLPPRWIIRVIWVLHRFVFRLGRGRGVLSRPTPGGQFGLLRLRVVGRRSGQERGVILGYIHDGADVVTLAMNGWGEAAPSWWGNLLAHPDAELDLPDGVRRVRARAAHGAERERLWAEISRHRGWGDDLDAFAALRPGETAVVVFEPRD